MTGEEQRLHIMTVDDQPGIRTLLDMVVKEEGHESILATNGVEAVEKYRTLNPDLVFMDVMMPLMDGITALQKISEFHSKPNVVIMTAMTEKEIIDKAYESGAVACLSKPFDIEDVRKIIRKMNKTHLQKD